METSVDKSMNIEYSILQNNNLIAVNDKYVSKYDDISRCV